MARIRPSGFEEGSQFRALRETIENPRGILTSIGALLVARSQKAFREQKMGDDRWAPRMNPNVPGIIADFTRGGTPPARRFTSQPVLQDTGRLRGSMAWQVVSRKAVEAGSNLPYAEALHTGGESESLPITETVQRRLWKWLRPKPRELKRQLGWMLNESVRDTTLTIRHPERPIVGLPDDLTQTIEELLGVTVRRAG